MESKTAKDGTAKLEIIKLNRLASTEGSGALCEICGSAAQFKCNLCPTSYCSKYHLMMDWHGALNQIHEDVKRLREASKRTVSRKKDSTDLNALRAGLSKRCGEIAQHFLVQGKFALAIPGALYMLKLSVEVHGTAHVSLISPYLLLAEANLGLRRLEFAEESLSLVKWNILKHPNVSRKVLSSLHRNFGRLYSRQNKYSEALNSFAADVYYSACEYGPLSARTAPAYFHMGQVFETHNNFEEARQFYDLSIECYWAAENHDVPVASASSPAAQDQSESLQALRDPIEKEEKLEVVRRILTFYHDHPVVEEAGGSTVVQARKLLCSASEELAESSSSSISPGSDPQ